MISLPASKRGPSGFSSLLLAIVVTIGLIASSSSKSAKGLIPSPSLPGEDLVSYDNNTGEVIFSVFEALGNVTPVVVNLDTARGECELFNSPLGFATCFALQVDCQCTHGGQGMVCQQEPGAGQATLNCLYNETAEAISSAGVSPCDPLTTCLPYLPAELKPLIAPLSAGLAKTLCIALSSVVGGSECAAECFDDSPELEYDDLVGRIIRIADLQGVHRASNSQCERGIFPTYTPNLGTCLPTLVPGQDLRPECSFSVGIFPPLSSANGTTPSPVTTTATEEPTTLASPFVCTAAGYYPSPSNPNSYYRCVENLLSPGSYTQYSFNCKVGLVWKPTSSGHGACDFQSS